MIMGTKCGLKAIELYGDEGDSVILISSSGESKNMTNAAKYVKKTILNH